MVNYNGMTVQEEETKDEMDMITYSETFKELKPLSVFGSVRSLQLLNPNVPQRLLLKPWKPCYVYATAPDTCLFHIKFEFLSRT